MNITFVYDNIQIGQTLQNNLKFKIYFKTPQELFKYVLMNAYSIEAYNIINNNCWFRFYDSNGNDLQITIESTPKTFKIFEKNSKGDFKNLIKYRFIRNKKIAQEILKYYENMVFDIK